MKDLNFFLEHFWGAILSREKDVISHSFLSLDMTSQDLVYTHLKKMCSEEGWHTEQVLSAKIALEVIDHLGVNNGY